MTDVYKDSTSHTYYFELVDSTTGLPKTGILYSDVTASYVRTRSARTAITPATLASASAAWSSGGFILVDDTNQPGVYRFDIPDAAFATGVDEVIVTVKATGCRTQSRKFTLVNINNQVAYVPNAAANANGGLPILSSSGTTLDYTISTLTTYTGNTVQTGDSYALIGATGSGLTSLATQASVDGLPTTSEMTAAFTQIKGATWSSTTDTLEAIRDRGDAAWTTGGGSSSLTVTPISTYIASRVESAQIEAYFAENGWTIGPVVVTDSDGDAVSLAAYSGLLRFTVETTAGVDVYTTTSVTISGTSNNQWSVTGNSAITATAPNVLRWSLRAIDTGLNVLLGRGPLKVVAAANQDA